MKTRYINSLLLLLLLLLLGPTSTKPQAKILKLNNCCMSQTTYGYRLGGQILVVIFDLLDVCSSQFGMITIADW